MRRSTASPSCIVSPSASLTLTTPSTARGIPNARPSYSGCERTDGESLEITRSPGSRRAAFPRDHRPSNKHATVGHRRAAKRAGTPRTEQPVHSGPARLRLERVMRSASRGYCPLWPSPQRHQTMTSQSTARGRFQRAIHARHVQNAETAAREMGGLSLANALMLCELLAKD